MWKPPRSRRSKRSAWRSVATLRLDRVEARDPPESRSSRRPHLRAHAAPDQRLAQRLPRHYPPLAPGRARGGHHRRHGPGRTRAGRPGDGVAGPGATLRASATESKPRPRPSSPPCPPSVRCEQGAAARPIIPDERRKSSSERTKGSNAAPADLAEPARYCSTPSVCRQPSNGTCDGSRSPPACSTSSR
jgi:hypothetical protein